MTVENGFCYFGYFPGMAYTKYKDKQLEEKLNALVMGVKEWRKNLRIGAVTTEDFLTWLRDFEE